MTPSLTTTAGSRSTRRVLTTVLLALLVLLAGCDTLPGGPSAGDGVQSPDDTGPGDATTASPTGTLDPTNASGPAGEAGWPDTETPAVGVPSPDDTGPGDATTASLTGTLDPTNASGPAGEAGWPETEMPAVGSIEGVTLPPGVDEAGTVNGSQLLAAHEENRPAPPFRARLDPLAVDADRDGTLVLTRGETRARLRQVTDGGTTTYWASGEAAVVGVHRAEQVTYARGRTAELQRLLALSAKAETAIAPYLLFGEFDLAGTVEVDDARLVKLQLTGIDAEALADSPYRPADGDASLVDASGSILLTQQGVVRRATIEVRSETDDGRDGTDTVRYALGGIESAELEAPDWLADAPRASVSVADDERTLLLENDGTEPIPAGTTVTLRAEGDELGTADLTEPLAPEEARYLVTRWDGENLTTSLELSTERPEPTRAHVNVTRYDTLVVEGEEADARFAIAVPFEERE